MAKFVYNPLLSAGLQQLQNNLADLDTKNHSDLDQLAWSVAGHTIDTDVDFNSNNATELGNVLFGADNTYDIATASVGLKRVYFAESAQGDTARNNFRGLHILGHAGGDIFIGDDNVFSGFYAQRIVTADSAATDNSTDITNLYQGDSDYRQIDINFNVGDGTDSGSSNSDVRAGGVTIGLYDSASALGGGGFAVAGRVTNMQTYMVYDEANKRFQILGYNASKAIQDTTSIGVGGGALTDFVPTADDQITLGISTLAWAGGFFKNHISLLEAGEMRFYDVGSSNYVGFEAPALTASQIYVLPATDGSANDIIKTDGSANLTFVTPTTIVPVALSTYDAEPARASETNLHGGLLSLATGQPLDSVPTNLVVTKGIGKVMIVINAGSDISGTITVTGESIDRETGASTPADTDTITVDALSTDSSDTDSNGNTRHAFAGAYITSKWFTGTVTLSTADLTLTDVDVYHVSFEQFNDNPTYEVDTFDANIFTTNVNAEFDAYLYALVVSGDKCTITREASLNVGANGETAIANKYWRLRKGNIGKSMVGTSDGVWADIHYSNSPSYIEDVSIKVWGLCTLGLTLT